MQARLYQEEAVAAIMAALDGFPSALLVAATGTGKTVCAGLLCANWPEDCGRILFLAHRRELVKQAHQVIGAWTGEPIDIEMGELYAEHKEGLWGAPPRIVIASKDTIKGRLGRYKQKDFGLVIVDECAHAVKKNDSWYSVIKHFGSAKILGLTPVPDRRDKESLGGIFKTVAYKYDILQAVHDAWLVPIQQQMLKVHGLELDRVRANKSGLNEHELDVEMRREQVVQGIVGPIISLANSGGQRRPTLFFATSVDQARLMAEVCNRHIPDSAVAVAGEDDMDSRDKALAGFRSGRYQFICNCAVLTEGWDEPRVRIVVPKPTTSRANYSQMCGRGTRPHPDCLDTLQNAPDALARRQIIRNSPKPSLLVVDPFGVSCQHKLVTTLDILGGIFTEPVKKKLLDDLKNPKGGEPFGVRAETLKALRAAREELRANEAKRKHDLVAHANFTMQAVDPFDLFDVHPKLEPNWLRGKMASVKQLDYILAHSGEVKLPDLSMHQASEIIAGIKAKKDLLPPTEKQLLLLQKFNIPTDGLTQTTASAAIDQLADNGWKPLCTAATSTK